MLSESLDERTDQTARPAALYSISFEEGKPSPLSGVNLCVRGLATSYPVADHITMRSGSSNSDTGKGAFQDHPTKGVLNHSKGG
jgi:hypothetical protein